MAPCPLADSPAAPGDSESASSREASPRPLSQHFDIPETQEHGSGNDGTANACRARPEQPVGCGSTEATPELEAALARRRSQLEARAQTFESMPEASKADASHLEGLTFDAPPLQKWLLQQEDPEEDRRPEFFAQGLRERGVVPAHAPGAGLRAEDVAKFADLARQLAALKEQVQAERAKLGSARADIERREQELRVRQAVFEAERQNQMHFQEELKSYPRPEWLRKIQGTMNVGVVGNSGVGKSLLINRLRGLLPGAAGWAPVGVRETTKTISMYAFPGERRVRLWDFPGAGTQAFPLETYVAKMGIRYLDRVIIVTAGRFTETEIALMKELKSHRVPYLTVRTKVDIDIWNNKVDNGCEAPETIRQITTDLQDNNGVSRPYLVSLRDTAAFDFPELLRDVFPCLAHGQTRNSLGAGWDDAWAIPMLQSPMATAIQGNWTDGQGSLFVVQGLQVHITSTAESKCATLLLEEVDGKVWWAGRWWISRESADRARQSGELRWSPGNLLHLRPMVWRWNA